MDLVAENHEHLTRWLHIPPVPKTSEERRKQVANYLAHSESGERHWWLIERSGELAGTIDIHRIVPSLKQGFVGYWLAEEFTGRGTATNSLRAVIDWAFSELGLVRLEIQSSIQNEASCAVPERLGIRREAIRRHSNIINGVEHDMASYVAFAENWPPKPPERALPPTEIRVDHEILLRQYSDADVDAQWKTIDEGRSYLGEYLPWIPAYPTEAEHTRLFNIRRREKDNFDGSGGYVIEYQGQFAGNVGFGIPNRDNGIEVGYWLKQDLQGRGIMTRSVEAVISMLIIKIGLRRVTIRAATTNLPSRGIPERLGFTHEGTMRDGGFVNNEYLDLEIYSILDHEWIARSKNA
jgi:ribosomal-protein-serine acetyltransferase